MLCILLCVVGTVLLKELLNRFIIRPSQCYLNQYYCTLSTGCSNNASRWVIASTSFIIISDSNLPLAANVYIYDVDELISVCKYVFFFLSSFADLDTNY